MRRILLLYAIAFAHGGLPLIYMGDELGLLNDASYLDDPHKARRQPLDAPARDGLGGGGAPPRPGDGRGPAVGRAAAPVAARRATRAIHVQGVVEPIWTGNDHVFGLCREQAGERLLVLGNFTADPQPVALAMPRDARLRADRGGRRRSTAARVEVHQRLRRAGAVPAPLAAAAER